MSIEKEIKKVKWVEQVIILVVLLMIIFGGFFGWKFFHAWRTEQKIKFMSLKIPRLAAVCVIKWSTYYDLGWLEVYSLLMTESNGKRKAISRKIKCKGYMQLKGSTAEMCRKRLQDKIKDCDIFATEFNIAAGCLYARSFLDGKAINDWLFTIELYNIGWYAYTYKGKRAKYHVERYGVNYSYFKREWQSFKTLF